MADRVLTGRSIAALTALLVAGGVLLAWASGAVGGLVCMVPGSIICERALDATAAVSAQPAQASPAAAAEETATATGRETVPMNVRDDGEAAAGIESTGAPDPR